ncbi:MAG: insulinase family protein [Candidatus Omnitrophica bacterium]|nr:insulinase family protein [Candidatus Omnitrophota bacterium]
MNNNAFSSQFFCRKIFFVSYFLISFLSNTAFSQDSANSSSPEISLQTSRYVLKNGLTVLITEMPSSPVVSVYSLVKTGSATEGKFLGSGVSHFLEHMLFKGTQNRPVGAISQEIQGLGGTINASTAHDYTIYTITLPVEAFDKALNISADMLMNSSFDVEEIQKEREVVYSEMKLRRDWPDSYLNELIFKTVFQQHPYGIPVIGYEDLFRKLKREDFLEYYQTHYIPNNIILSIAGNVQAKEILPRIEEVFKNFQRQSYPPRNVPEELSQVLTRQYEEQYPTDLTRISLNFQGVSARHSDMFALDIFAMILGQGESSRLYKELFKKKRYVRSISAWNFTPIDSGVFSIEMVLDDDAEKKTKALNAIRLEIRRIVQEGVAGQELDKVKRQLISQYIQGYQTTGQVASRSAMDEMIFGDCDFSKKYLDSIRKVKSDDVRRVAQQYLAENKMSLVILRPQREDKTVSQAPAAPVIKKIQKIILENGLTLLLRENHAIPLVSIHVALQGGTRQESEEKNGLSQLTSRLWVKGTTSRKAHEIVESVESRGAQLNGFSGRNSFGISLNLLSQDLPFGIDLLSDLIKNPTFEESELILEKDQEKTAIIALQDDLHYSTGKELRKLLFQTHPLRLEPLGTTESIDGITREDIKNFYQELLSSENMVISVFGDFNPQDVMALFKEKLADLPTQQVQLKTYQESPPKRTRRKVVQMNKEQAMVMMGFHAVELSHPDYYGFEVLSSILGSSFNGRIFNRIREQFGQAYTLGGNWMASLDKGMIYFFVATTPELATQVEETLKALIADLQQRPITPKELQETQMYLKGTFQMELETNAALGFMTALDELYGFGYNRFEKYAEEIDHVTVDDVQRLAQEYLSIHQAAIVVSMPQKKKDTTLP